jgi:outer membrane receptor for ferrienterochelin and colicins
MRVRALAAPVLSAALAIGFPLPVSAQSATFLSVVVTSDGAPVAGADVELKGNNVDVHRVTDAKGSLSFNGLSVGSYEVSAKKGELSAVRSVDLVSGGATIALELQVLQKIGQAVVSARPNVTRSSGTDIVLNADSLQKLPNGNSLPNILLQLPTAARGSNGQIHINGDHNGIQYVLDGVPLADSLNRVVGNEIDPSTIGFINVLEGAYPAQYGGPFATILDIGTKAYSGAAGASFQGQVGSYNDFDGILDLHAPVGRGGSLVLSGRMGQNGRAIDPATQDAPHDTGSVASQFLRLSLPAGEKDYVNFDFIHSLQTFQIPPDVNNGVPAFTNDNEYQSDTFAALQFRHQIGTNASLSFGPSFKHSRILDTNDPANDLAAGANPANACGPSGDFSDCPVFSVFADRSFSSLAFNADYLYHSSRHEVRAGALTSWQNVPKNYVITLQSGNNLAPKNQNGTFTAIDNGTINGASAGLYAQDGWQIAPRWRVDYGVRFDSFAADSTTGAAPFSKQYNQTSPRVKLTYSFSPRASVYAYYGRLFVPFSLETVDPATAASLYLPGTVSPVFDLKPQRDSLYEAGFHIPLGAADAGFRISHKVSTDYLDDTQVGSTNLHQDINFPLGIIDVQAIHVQAPLANKSTAYLSVAHVTARNSANCETQLLQNCAAGGPAGGPFVQSDHDQHWTASGGLVLNDKRNGWFALDGEYGSGLSQDPASCPPAFDTLNCKVPPHMTFNVAKAFGFPFGQLIFSMTNMFNDRYAITLNNSLQGTHWAQPRSFDFRFVFGKTQ